MLFRGPRSMDEAPPGMLGMPGLAASCKLLVCLCSQSLGWFMRVKPQNCLASSKQSLVGSCTMYCPPTDVLEAAESSLWIQALWMLPLHTSFQALVILKSNAVWWFQLKELVLHPLADTLLLSSQTFVPRPGRVRFCGKTEASKHCFLRKHFLSGKELYSSLKHV